MCRILLCVFCVLVCPPKPVVAASVPEDLIVGVNEELRDRVIVTEQALRLICYAALKNDQTLFWRMLIKNDLATIDETGSRKVIAPFFDLKCRKDIESADDTIHYHKVSVLDVINNADSTGAFLLSIMGKNGVWRGRYFEQDVLIEAWLASLIKEQKNKPAVIALNAIINGGNRGCSDTGKCAESKEWPIHILDSSYQSTMCGNIKRANWSAFRSTLQGSGLVYGLRKTGKRGRGPLIRSEFMNAICYWERSVIGEWTPIQGVVLYLRTIADDEMQPLFQDAEKTLKYIMEGLGTGPNVVVPRVANSRAKGDVSLLDWVKVLTKQPPRGLYEDYIPVVQYFEEMGAKTCSEMEKCLSAERINYQQPCSTDSDIVPDEVKRQICWFP